MDILRGNIVIATVHPTDDSVHSCKLMGENIVKLNFRLAAAIDLIAGDHIVWAGQTFTLKPDPTIREISSREVEYTCEFLGIDYELAKVGYKLFDNTPIPLQGDFPLNAKALTFIQLLVDNLNRNGEGWTVGEVIDTEFKNLTFTNEDCMAVLQRLATEFETEYYITAAKSVNLRKKPYTAAVITLAYGQGNGLKSLTRNNRDDDPIITCLFAYGSDKNLPTGYRNGSTRLMLPAEGYLLQNVTQYGVREGDKIFEDIYPRLLANASTDPGKVTAVSGNLKFTDANLDFDVNEFLSEKKAKVVFNTGKLAGYEFEIVSFDNITKTFTLVATEYDGTILPNDLFCAAAGDRYVLIDLIMPDAYVAAAEIELAAKALEYLAEYSKQRDSFKSECDTMHFKRNNIAFSAGQVVRIQSVMLGVDREIRVIGYAQNLNEPFKYDAEFGEKPIAGKIEKLANNINNTAAAVASSQTINWQTTLELLELIKGAQSAVDFSAITGLPANNAALKEYLDRIKDNAYVDTETKLISGAIVWKTGLTYTSTDISYKILGVKYAARAKEITLADADPNLSRIDMFYVDIFGNLQVKQGIPAVNPSSPVLDATQLEVMTVFLVPGALEPSNVDIDKVYDENTGWATSETHDAHVSVDFESTDAPVSGSKRVRVGIAIPDTEISRPLHYIGEKYQGGRIFWLDSAGNKGLIAAENDTATDVFWSRLSGSAVYSTGATGVLIGTGQANTTLMLANSAAKDQAAKLINELVVDGFTDWYLPSEKELDALFFRRYAIGNLGNKTYWSSTESDWKKARCIEFGGGAAFTRDKNNRFCIRACRSFDDTTLPTGIPVETFTPVSTNLSFVSAAAVATAGGILSLNIKSSVAWNYNSMILIESYLGAIKTGSVAISPTTNLFGYKPDSDVWQLIAIQIYNFASDKTTLDKFRISLVGNWPNNIDIGLDDIRYQHSTIITEGVSIVPGTFGSVRKSAVVTVNAQGVITDISEVDTLDINTQIIIDFQTLTPFLYTCPAAMKFTEQISQGAAAGLSIALNTNMAQFQQLTVTPAVIGMVILNGILL
jgi:hypothetical protein